MAFSWANLGKFALNTLPIVGSYFQAKEEAKTARENTDKTIAANKALAEYQYSKDVEMWNANNLYNSPESQMERLKAAGLNPNLVYGSGSVVGNTSGQIPKYNAPSVQYNYRPSVNLPQMLGMYQDFQLRQAQIDNLQAQKRATEARTTIDLFNYSVRKPYAEDLESFKYQTAYERKNQAETKTLNDWVDYTRNLKQWQVNEPSYLLKTQLEVQRMQLDNELRQIQNNLEGMRKTPYDQAFINMFGSLLGKFIPNFFKGTMTKNVNVRGYRP